MYIFNSNLGFAYLLGGEAEELRQVKMFGFQIYILVLTVVAFIII